MERTGKRHLNKGLRDGLAAMAWNFWKRMLGGVWARREAGKADGELGQRAGKAQRLELEARIRQQSQAMTASRTQFAYFLDVLAQGVLQVDADGRIRAANPAAAAMLSVDAKRLIGRTLAQSVGPRFREDGLQEPLPDDAMPDAVALRTGLTVRDHVMGIRPSGCSAMQWLAVDAIPIGVQAGAKSGGAWVILADITARKEMKALLIETQKMESVGRLAGGVAHDFNNCLFCVLGLCEMTLETLPAGAPLREPLEQIQMAARQAAGITRQLLAFVRKEAPNLAPIDLNRLIRDQLKMLIRLLGEHIRVDLRCRDTQVVARVDATQFVQVLLNLCLNARDAMPNGGTLTVETSGCVETRQPLPGQAGKPGRYIRIRILDTGVGMSAATLKRLFTPFFTTKTPIRGTGLGLSVVHGIVAQHGGWIAVDSEEGKGSRFDLYFPAAPERLPADAPEVVPEIGRLAAAPRPAFGGRMALLVEDEDLVRFVEARLLRDLGYEVLEAETVEQGRRRFAQSGTPAELLLSDVVLPDGFGTTLAEELSRLRPELKIVMCSGYGDEKSRYHEIRRRGWEFVEKPFSKKILAEAIQRAARGGATVPFPLL